MNSLKAFLSTCTLIGVESDLHVGDLTILVQNDQPALLFDHTDQPQPFLIVPIADPESLNETDMAVMSVITEQPEWIVVVDRANQVRGIIKLRRIKDLRIAVKATIEGNEFGSTITALSSQDKIKVLVSYYGCREHPEVGRFALHQIGAPTPYCPRPKCGKPMTKIQEKGTHTKAKR